MVNLGTSLLLRTTDISQLCTGIGPTSADIHYCTALSFPGAGFPCQALEWERCTASCSTVRSSHLIPFHIPPTKSSTPTNA